tara:strand:- start:66523 stop:67353 length:831 start_codon:yes stop_codon:yes gene_type:complete
MTTNGAVSAADQLRERLNDPKVAEGLNRLLDRIDLVSFAVESMDGFISRSEVISESVASAVGEVKGLTNGKTAEMLNKAPQLLQTGSRLTEAAGDLDVDELSRSRILHRLTDPNTLQAINQLLDHLPLAAFLLESFAGFVQRSETIADNVADAVAELNLKDWNIDPAQFDALMKGLPQLKIAGEQLLNSRLMGDGLPDAINASISLLDSGMLDKDVVEVLGELGKKGADTYREVASRPVEPIGGLFATLRATKDPDVQKSVGFFFAFAKAFAKHLK